MKLSEFLGHAKIMARAPRSRSTSWGLTWFDTSSNSNIKTLHWQVAWCRCGVSFQDAAGVAGVQTAKPLGILCRECQVVLQGGRTCESACASILGRRTSLEKMTVAHGGSLKSGKNATVYGAIACVVRPFARTDHASCVKSPFPKLLPFWTSLARVWQQFTRLCRDMPSQSRWNFTTILRLEPRTSRMWKWIWSSGSRRTRPDSLHFYDFYIFISKDCTMYFSVFLWEHWFTFFVWFLFGKQPSKLHWSLIFIHQSSFPGQVDQLQIFAAPVRWDSKESR